VITPNKSELEVRKSKNHEFRISTAVQPVFYRTNKTVEKLKQPKQVFEPTKPYLNQEFRGLLNADYQDALLNCVEYDEVKHRP